MTYREPLRDDCPPDEAEDITSVGLVYRLVRSVPPNDEDFRSHRTEKPTAQCSVSEGMSRGLSVYTNLGDVEKQTKKPNLKQMTPCLVTLTAGAGRIEKTGRGSHHTWWPYGSYDIVANCQSVNT